MCLILILAPAVLANHSPRTQYKSQHETVLADLNWCTAKTLHLLIILMNDAIMYMCIWLLAWCNTFKPLLFINTSLVISHLFIHWSKRKINNGRIKGLTMDKFLSEQQIHSSALISSIVREYWLYPLTADGSYSRQTKRQAG